MKIAITGANGFLGSHLTRHLMTNGHEVTAFVRRASDLSRIEEHRPRFVFGDLSESRALTDAFRGQNAVFHLAALNAVRPADFEKLESVNVEGTRNALEAAIGAGVNKFIHVSSVVAIGASPSPGRILDESSAEPITDVRNFESKRRGEELVREAALRGRIFAVIVNPSMVYGAGDARKEARQGNVQVAKGKVPFFTSGGVNVVAVEDVIQGMVAAWQKGRNGERYILSGENLTMEELLAQIALAAGQRAPALRLPSWMLGAAAGVSDFLRTEGPLTRENIKAATLYHWFDNSKARRELDFRPGPASEAIRKSVQWMKDSGLI